MIRTRRDGGTVNLSDSGCAARRTGMTNKTKTDHERAAHSAAAEDREKAIEVAGARVRALLGASAPHPERLNVAQVAIECEERSDGIGWNAALIVIPAGEAPHFDTFWGFGWRDALDDLVEFVEDARSGCTAEQVLEVVHDCGSDAPPWTPKRLAALAETETP